MTRSPAVDNLVWRESSAFGQKLLDLAHDPVSERLSSKASELFHRLWFVAWAEIMGFTAT